MNLIKSEEHLAKIIDYLQNVYWKNIKADDPLYLDVLHSLKKLCESYNVKYNTDVDTIYNKFLNNKSYKLNTSSEVLHSLKVDLESCSTIENVTAVKKKYSCLCDEYCNAIANYVTNYTELKKILHGEIESETQKIINFPSLEERLNPTRIPLYDDEGWPLTDENGNDLFKIETVEEIKQRIENENNNYEKTKLNITNLKNSLSKWIEYIIILPKLSIIYGSIIQALNSISTFENDMILKDFNNDVEFINNLNNVMQHNLNEVEYLYHGASCIEDAESILSNGLYMASDDLESTTYSEFTPEQLLLYSRGFAGEIGRDAIVIIKKPKNEVIVTKLSQENVNVAQSGLGGFSKMRYVIPKKYIIGYINKKDKIVVHNQELSIDNKPKL